MVEAVRDVYVGEERTGVAQHGGDVVAQVEGVRGAIQIAYLR